MKNVVLGSEETFTGKKTLVTGGAGFIGSNLAAQLIELGASVTVVDNLDPETGANLFNLANIREQIEWIEADIQDEKAMRTALIGQDYLFDLAGLSSHVGSTQAPLRDLEANTFSHLKLLEYCRRINPYVHIVYAGTRQVYGRVQRLPANEEQLPSPVDQNGVSKLAAEHYHLLYHNLYGLWTSSLRMTNVYGPHMRIKDDHKNFLGWWIRLLLEGKNLPIYGDGLQTRDLNYVDDVITALLYAVTNPIAQGQLYNLGAEPVSLLELARLLIDLNGSGNFELVPFPENRLRIEIGHYAGDYTKIRTQLGWEPAVALTDGLQKTLAFYRQFGAHYGN